MPFLTVIITVVIIVVALHLINTRLRIKNAIKDLINIVVILSTLFWFLQTCGLLPWQVPTRLIQ